MIVAPKGNTKLVDFLEIPALLLLVLPFEASLSDKEWEEKPWKKRGESYEKFKEAMSKKILEVVYKHVPEIENAMDYYELSTPLSVRDMDHYPKGEMYGLDHSSQRFRQDWIRPKSVSYTHLTLPTNREV